MVGKYGKRGSSKSKDTPLFLSFWPFAYAQSTNTQKKNIRAYPHVLIYCQFQLQMIFAS